MAKKTAKKSKKLNILFVAAEVAPFTKAGGIADVVSSLASVLKKQGHDVRIATPKHGTIRNERFQLQKVKDNLAVRIDKTTTEKFNVLKSFAKEKVPVYFIDNEEFFSSRRSIYGYWDDAHRFQFFDLAVLEMLKTVGFRPDVIHCHDWHAGLIPWYLKIRHRKLFSKPIATIYTIHNLQYQGIINEKFAKEEEKDDGRSQLPLFDSGRTYTINFTKRGIIHSDLVNAVSPQYARDILTPKYGEGLDKLLRENRGKLYGILNGIDYDIFSPATDKNIKVRYDLNSIEKKYANKALLQQAFGLKEEKDVPLIGMASRLAAQKGIDMIMRIMPSLLKLNFQFVVVGSGEERYQDFFWQLAQEYPKRVAAHLNFDTAIASEIYAASDIYLMPSEFEPCGLTQLIAMKYGSIPVVHSTGGLTDTVENFNPANASGTGFTFKEYEENSLLIALIKALEDYKHKRSWRDLVRRAMEKDFSWHHSAQRYLVLYQRAIRKVAPQEMIEVEKVEDLAPATPAQPRETTKIVKFDSEGIED